MIDTMQKIRDAAIKVLHPSTKDLEHGLELHKESYVFDAYGFMPLGRSVTDRLKKLIEQHAGRDEVFGAFEEAGMDVPFQDADMVRRLKEAWDFAGVDCIFQNAGTEGNDMEIMLKRFSNYAYIADLLPDILEKAVFPHQLRGIRDRGKKALYFTTNGVPLSFKFISAEEELAHISVFFKLGVRMMHVTYNRRNLIGDGCAETADAGLSDFGRSVIREMNRVGVIPDVAHSGQNTSAEAARCSTKPVVASHSCAWELSHHYRAKKDDVMKAVAESGGYIGICAQPCFLKGSYDINSFLDHIDYSVRKIGVDHVAIGTDAWSFLNEKPVPVSLPPFRPIWEQYWRNPGDAEWQGPQEKMDSLHWFNWPMFTVGLVQRGYSDEEIRKIIGGNVLRVIEDSLK